VGEDGEDQTTGGPVGGLDLDQTTGGPVEGLDLDQTTGGPVEGLDLDQTTGGPVGDLDQTTGGPVGGLDLDQTTGGPVGGLDLDQTTGDPVGGLDQTTGGPVEDLDTGGLPRSRLSLRKEPTHVCLWNRSSIIDTVFQFNKISLMFTIFKMKSFFHTLSSVFMDQGGLWSSLEQQDALSSSSLARDTRHAAGDEWPDTGRGLEVLPWTCGSGGRAVDLVGLWFWAI